MLTNWHFIAIGTAAHYPWSAMSTHADAPSRCRARAQIRTHGCQMNVHDSERLAGLLEEAGYVARCRRTARPTWWSSTPAQSARTPTTGSTAASGTCCPAKKRTARHADRGRRLPGPEGPAATIVARAPWVDVVFGTHNIGSLPVLLERARHQRTRPRSRSSRPCETFPSNLPTRRESAYAAWVSIIGRLQQHLHVLHRARRCAAGRRTAGPATSSPRSRRWWPRASSEVTLLGQNVNSYGVEFGDRSRVRASCCAPAARSTGLERVRFTSPAPEGLHRRRDRRDGRDART